MATRYWISVAADGTWLHLDVEDPHKPAVWRHAALRLETVLKDSITKRVLSDLRETLIDHPERVEAGPAK